MEISKVGVVGCGIMGSGIAQVCAQSGYQVVVSEINDELLNKGLSSINSSLAKSVDKGEISPPDKDSISGRIKGTTALEDFSNCDLVIEAIVENLEAKKKVFAQLDRICSPHTILATNTSVIPILNMASQTSRPDKVVGLHFSNPVPVMKIVEMVRTIAASDQTMERAKKFVSSLGKTYVIARDTPGFIIARLLTPFVLDAIRMLEAGMATKEDIDTAIHLGLNHPMGPLTLSDMVGIDTIYFAASAIYEETKDARYAPPPLMKQMVIAGWLGRKTGKGFYEYGK